MSNAPRRDKPAPVSLNLDSLERETDEVKEPYSFVLDGRTWTALNPNDADWQDLADLDIRDLRAVLRLFLGDDYADFEKVRLPGWKVNKLSEAIVQHYGLANLGEAPAS
jgi:hypothetical protein